MKTPLKYLLPIKLLLCCWLWMPQLAQAESANMYIGIDADLSAVAVEGGVAISRGVELAVAQINQEGGLLGKRVKVIQKDHRGNPARGIHNIRQLAETEGILAVVGGVHTPVALASLPVIHEKNLLYLGPWAAGTQVVDNGYVPNNVFRISVRDAEAGKVMVAHATERGFKRVALVLERTAWGRSNETSISQAAAAAGVTIDSVYWINWQQPEFGGASTLLESDVDAVMLVTNAPEGSVVINSLHQTGQPQKPIISHWGIAGGNFVENVGLKTLAEMDICVLQTFSFLRQRHPEALALLASYRRDYGDVEAQNIPAVTGLAHAYDLTLMLAEAVRQTGSTDTNALRTALEQISQFRGAVKRYASPFTASRHDALWAEDYFMASYSSQGRLLPRDAHH
ncbi:ABC transporter substrate-binding protein [Alteromonas sp. ASW11-19]|uniref:ABC transporter substrate-binding protein n=1 Tax=Alteromonas salexigens TaxID=2982530 RepID=A0ABT2VK20_9ALTE|nr:ABC transporter substrate-binding protein [Alteromonas salexigens]MCU7553163.1 ABC transporter substrate-binding protein [Alteromonas salexigens]